MRRLLTISNFLSVKRLCYKYNDYAKYVVAFYSKNRVLIYLESVLNV